MLIAFVAISALVAIGFTTASFDRSFVVGGEALWNAAFIAASLTFLGLLVRLVVAVAREHIAMTFDAQHPLDAPHRAAGGSRLGYDPRRAVSGDSPVRHHAHAAHDDAHLRHARTGHAHEEAPR